MFVFAVRWWSGLNWSVSRSGRESPLHEKKKVIGENRNTFSSSQKQSGFICLLTFFFFFKVHCGGTVFTRPQKKPKNKTFQISHFRTKSLVFFSARRDDLNPTYPATRSQLSKPLPDKSAGPISQLKPRDIIFFLFFHTHYCRGLTEWSVSGGLLITEASSTAVLSDGARG